MKKLFAVATIVAILFTGCSEEVKFGQAECHKYVGGADQWANDQLEKASKSTVEDPVTKVINEGSFYSQSLRHCVSMFYFGTKHSDSWTIYKDESTGKLERARWDDVNYNNKFNFLTN